VVSTQSTTRYGEGFFFFFFFFEIKREIFIDPYAMLNVADSGQLT
jgi:hypothetical protein